MAGLGEEFLRRAGVVEEEEEEEGRTLPRVVFSGDTMEALLCNMAV